MRKPRRSGPCRTPPTTSTSTPADRARPLPGDDQPASRSAAALAARLGIAFRDPGLLERALVHGSWLHEHPDGAPGHNERLEFLGDSVISLVVSEALHARHPADDEGVLSARRASIVSAKGLARLARRIDLGDAILLGEGEARRPCSHARSRPWRAPSSWIAGGTRSATGCLSSRRRSSKPMRPRAPSRARRAGCRSWSSGRANVRITALCRRRARTTRGNSWWRSRWPGRWSGRGPVARSGPRRPPLPRRVSTRSGAAPLAARRVGEAGRGPARHEPERTPRRAPVAGVQVLRRANGGRAVSYTHLRAHETRHDLVCR